MFIHMVISSKNKNSLKFFFKTFQYLLKNKDLFLNSNLAISQKQTRNKLFTVLKSPHVNKTAQEQFEFRLFTKIIRIYTFQILKIFIVLKKIQTTIFGELKLSLKLNFDFKSKKKIFSKFLNPQNFTLSFYKLFSVIPTQLLLSSINYYGKQKLISSQKY